MKTNKLYTSINEFKRHINENVNNQDLEHLYSVLKNEDSATIGHLSNGILSSTVVRRALPYFVLNDDRDNFNICFYTMSGDSLLRLMSNGLQDTIDTKRGSDEVYGYYGDPKIFFNSERVEMPEDITDKTFITEMMDKLKKLNYKTKYYYLMVYEDGETYNPDVYHTGNDTLGKYPQKQYYKK